MEKLIASEGKWLYNGEVFAHQVITPNKSLWKEVTDEEKIKIESTPITEDSEVVSESKSGIFSKISSIFKKR